MSTLFRFISFFIIIFVISLVVMTGGPVNNFKPMAVYFLLAIYFILLAIYHKIGE